MLIFLQSLIVLKGILKQLLAKILRINIILLFIAKLQYTGTVNLYYKL